MENDIKTPWILAGYELFSKYGPDGLKVEALARIVNKNKSSFYHHFADLDLFINRLLEYHIKQSEIITKRESQCKAVVPELLNVIIEFKQDLLFNRQLRIHRNEERYLQCFQTASQGVTSAIVDIWAAELGIVNDSNLARMVLNLSIENFYLQITDKTLTYEWLEAYVNQLKCMVQAFQNNNA